MLELWDEFPLDPPLPAIVVGHRIGDAGEQVLRDEDEPPPWLVWLQHQYGGYATKQVHLAGALLPLAHAPGSPARELVLEGLAALGDERRRAPAIARFPELAALHLTKGRAYDVSQTETLAQFLAGGFVLPPIERAYEAFVELGADLGPFDGWPVFAREIPRASHLADADAHQVVMRPSAVRPGRVLDAPLVAAIGASARRLGATAPPRAFLVWLNSD